MIESNNIQQPKKFKILLLGDHCIDVYQYGTVDRISPEAPVPVFKFQSEERKLGMAGNVKNNLEALGCDVTYLHDKTSIKTRLIDKKSNQHIVRIDEDELSDVISFSKLKFDEYDAIVISDYNKGTISYDLVVSVRKKFKGPIFIDTKKQDLEKFDGCIVKINELEYNNRYTINDSCIVTLGSKGAKYIKYFEEKCYEASPSEVVDVTGAGDTFLAALTFEYLRTTNMDKSILFAIRASAVTVNHMGVYAPSLEEI